MLVFPSLSGWSVCIEQPSQQI